MNYILDRLKEKTTWLGLVAVLTGFGVAIEPELQESVIAVGVAVAGLIGVITKEKK